MDIIDPIGDPDPTLTEKLVGKLLGTIAAVRREMQAFWDRVAEKDPVCPVLMYQLEEALQRGYFHTQRVQLALRYLVEAALGAEQERAPQRALEEAQRREAEARMLVLGARELPVQWGKLGKLASGHDVGVPLDRALSMVGLGPPGQGKSYLGVLVVEMWLLRLLGLNKLVRPGRAFVFAADWNKGQTRHQHLAGLRPNPNQQQWHQLRQDFGIRVVPHLARLRRVIMGILPGRLAVYQQMYPDLMEQGLEFRETYLHPTEWKAHGYRVMLGGAQGKERTLYQGFLDRVVARLGDEAHPAEVLKMFDESGLGGVGRPAVREGLELMVRMTSEQEHYASLLQEEDALVVNYLESTSMGQDLILPLQTAQMNVLSTAAPGDVPVLMVVEEGGKQGKNVAVVEYFEGEFGERRHGLRGYYIGAHGVGDVSAKLISTASLVAQFGGVNLADYRRLQDLRPEFAGLSHREVSRSERGVPWIGASESNYPQCSQQAVQVHLRPSCIADGGETRTMSDGWQQQEEEEE